MTRTRLDAIDARAAAADRHVTDLCAGRERWTMRIPADEARDSDLIISAALADIPALLAVARAARLVKAQCDDMCPSWYDEPCDCGMAALRAALAPLLEPEP